MKNTAKRKLLKRTILRSFGLIVVLFAQVVWSGAYAQTNNLTIQQKNITVKEVLNFIEKGSQVVFFYSDKDVDLNRRLNLNMVNQPVSKILDELFKSSSNAYKIDGKQVYIIKKLKQVEKTVKPANKTIKISGVISDDKNQTVIGATVMLNGTSTGTVSDLNGRFSLETPDNGKLKISYIGYETKIVDINGQSSLNISLSQSLKNLEEVVVVAYGSQKKESVTGAISTVRTKDLKHSSSANLQNALSGRIAGLSSIQSSGQPGKDNAVMYLRGAGTSNSTNPLILIDGVPRENIGVIDPNEVASISVLKDASATAVFGVRGANGVILITTKRGEAGKMQLSLVLETSAQSFTREPQKLDSWDYMRLKNEASLNDKMPEIYSQADISKYTNPNKNELESYMYPSHNYYGEMMRTYAPQTRTSLNMSGGSEKMQYFVNAAYIFQGGQFKTEPVSDLGYDPQFSLNRYSFRANIDYKVTKNIKAFLNVSSYLEKVAMPSAKNYGGDENAMIGDVFRSLQYSRPFEMGPTTIKVPGSSVPDGEVIKFGNLLRTGYEIVNRTGYRNETRMNFNGSYGMEWDMKSLLSGLSLKGMLSFDNKSATAMEAFINTQQYTATILNNSSGSKPVFSTNMGKGSMGIEKAANFQYNVNLQGSLNYSKIFSGIHRIGGLVMVQRDYWESVIGEIPYNVLGLSGRVTYAYNDRYLGEFNAGYNGSEQFAPNNRFGFFPAVSLGWIVSNEEFFKPINNFVTNLKFRASYGEVGNDKLGTARFLYIDDIYYKSKSTNGNFGEFFLNSLSNGYYIDEGKVGNPNLTWEVAKKQNYGADIQLFNSLTLSFDYFLENRSQILITRAMVPILQGIDLSYLPKANMGKINNHGFEVEIDFNKEICKDFFINVKGNLNYNKNKVIFMDEPELPEDYVYRYRQTGFPLGTTFGYAIDYSKNGNGYFNSLDEITNYVDKNGKQIIYDFGNYGLGDFKYIDQNGDGIVNEKDKVPLGKTMIPEISYGISLGANYKNFDFSILFQGLGNTSMNYSNEGVYENLYSGYYFDYHRTAWTQERFDNHSTITYPALHLTSNTNHTVNSFFVMNRAFTRLKNVEFGFTLPKKWCKPINISNFRIYISGQNLFTWDNLRMKTLDPEQFSATSNLSGIVYPVTKMVNAGANITF